MLEIVLMACLCFQQPTELQRQLRELQKEIAETKILVEQIKSDKSASKEVNRQADRAKKLTDRRNQQAARIRSEVDEVREANRRLNARLRADLLAAKLAKEQIESPEIRMAREIQLKALLQLPKPTEEQKMLIIVVKERNEAQEKIRRQNNRRICRWFNIGCIGRK